MPGDKGHGRALIQQVLWPEPGDLDVEASATSEIGSLNRSDQGGLPLVSQAKSVWSFDRFRPG